MKLIGLDVGEKRIGVAWANSEVKMSAERPVVLNDAEVASKIAEVIEREKAEIVVVGLPRNSQGEETKQSTYVRQFVDGLNLSVPVYFQDESLTSVLAEQSLKNSKKQYAKGDIDSRAAALILNDYLEENF